MNIDELEEGNKIASERGLVLGFEKGYIEIEDYPRADKATIVHATGETIEVRSGETEAHYIMNLRKK